VPKRLRTGEKHLQTALASQEFCTNDAAQAVPAFSMTSRTARVQLLGAVALWIAAYLALTAGYFGGPAKFPLDMAMRRAVLCVFGFLLCLAMMRVHAATIGWKLPNRLLLGLGCSILAAFVYAEANFTAFYVFNPIWGESRGLGDHVALILYVMRLMVWVFVAWSALYFAIEYDASAREQQLRVVEAQALTVDAQNRMLRYQINPHFLFNTLNALSTLVLEKDTGRAERMILALSAFLRHALEKDLGDKIPLADEIEVQTQYLSIEQIRFGDRLRFVDRVPAALRQIPVPSLILQPLVENAVKHGVGVAAGTVTLELSAERDGDAVVLTLSDDAAPALDAAAPPRLGVGLENVRRRLEAEYGPAASFTCARREPAGFTVTLRLPLESR